MTKKILCSILLTALILSASLSAPSIWAAEGEKEAAETVGVTGEGPSENEAKKEKGEGFRVVGYYSGGLFDEPVENLRTDQLTHVIYAFLIPQMDGSCLPLEKPDQLRAIVEQAHRDGAKVYIGVGGWSYQNVPLVTTFETIGGDDQLRAKFVSSVLSCVREYDLDGVELDWEHPMGYSAESYEKTVLDLHKALKGEGKDLTAALNGAWSTTAGPETSSYISQKCLDAFAFICVMGYDMNNEDHSPFWFGNTSIEYWKNRGVPGEKIVLGMPLYARPSWMQYRHLVEVNPEYAYNDYAATQPLASYYNGLKTLCRKTVLAYEKAGGVMLFDVNEDASGEYSAVRMIHDTISQIKTYGFLTGFAADAVEVGGEIRETVATEKEIDMLLRQRDSLGQITERWIYMNPRPILESNRTLVPVRVTSDRMDFAVEWDGERRQVLISGENMEILLTIDSKRAVKRVFSEKNDGKPEETTLLMDCPPQIINGRTMIPLRFVSENFGRRVDWDPETLEVFIDL